jgi:hydroxyacylglutathione hydrolase
MIETTGSHPGESIAQFEIGPHRNFVYLILDWSNRKAALVDPQKGLTAPLDVLKKEGFNLQMILLTHTHSDHTAGLSLLIQQFPGITIAVHEQEAHRLTPTIRSTTPLRWLQEGESLNVGEIPLRVLHTPGHSAGACCFLVATEPPALLTGDTVFIRDCGRTDLDSGSNEEMFQSLQKIRKLPPETIIFPGHHYAPEWSSTLEKELQESPPFQCKTPKELEELP